MYLDPREVTHFKQALKLANRNIDQRRVFKAKNLSNYKPIAFVLDNRLVQIEKIIEGWICRHLRTQHLQSIFGRLTFFANNYQIGYLQGIDIFGYCSSDDEVLFYVVVEVKKDRAKFPDNFQQLKGYIDWTIEFMAHGDSGMVYGFLVAQDFDSSDVTFVERYNKVNPRSPISLVKFKYQPPLYDRLLMGIVNEI